MPIERFEDLDLSRRYTYADYVTWKFQERVELFKGWVMRMAGPNTYHQRVSSLVSRRLGNAIEPFGCETLVAPTDVLLSLSEEGDTIVQPDILVVCDSTQIKKQYVEGAPDFIAEIVSPGNGRRELDKKFKYYREAGVREYWVIHPGDKTILRWVLNEAGDYVGLEPRTVDSEAVECSIFPGVSLRGADIFP